MGLHSFRASIRQGLAWLMCLALLVPVAMSTAIWHGIAHGLADGIGGARQSGDREQGSLPVHCEQCLAGAAIGTAALPAAPAALLPPLLRHSAPAAALPAGWFAAPLRAYRSRAPPFSAH